MSPSTRAPDGDPLDAMVVWDMPTYPGVVIACRPLGALKVSQKSSRKKGGRERNDRVIVVPVGDARSDELKDVNDIPSRVRKELEELFRTAVLLENKGVALLGWDGAGAANALIDKAANAYSSGPA